MKKFVISVIVNAVGLFLITKIVAGIGINGLQTAEGLQTLAAAAIVLAIINIVIKPVIRLITLPINILSLGIFSLIINAFLLYGVSKMVKGFYVDGFGPALLGALMLSVISVILEYIIGPQNQRILKHRNDSAYKRDVNIIDVEAEEVKNDTKHLEDKK